MDNEQTESLLENQEDAENVRNSGDTFSIHSADSIASKFSEIASERTSGWRSVLHDIVYGYIGIKLLLLAHFFGSAMTAVTKMLEASTNPPMHALQVIFARMLITYITAFTYMHYTGVEDFVLGPKKVRHWLVLRGIIGFGGLFGLYYSLLYLPLSDAVVLTFLSPIVTGICAWLFLGEIFTKVEAIGGAISLVGVVVIARPTFLLPGGGGSDDSLEEEEHRALAVTVGMVGVLSAGLVIVVIRKIGFQAHALISVSYFSLWSTIVSFFALLIVPDVSFVLPTTMKTWFLLILVGILGFIFQFLLTTGFQRTKAGKGAAMAYTSVLWAIIWDKVLFERTPDIWSILGGGLIIGSAIWVAVSRTGEPNDLRSRSTTSLQTLEIEEQQV